jgi:hypothetical protein
VPVKINNDWRTRQYPALIRCGAMINAFESPGVQAFQPDMSGIVPSGLVATNLDT